MNAGVIIREARAGDAVAIVPLMRALACAHIDSDASRYSELARACVAYQAALGGQGGQGGQGADARDLLWLVALVEERVCGYLLAEHVRSDDLIWSPEHVCVHDIIVELPVRSRGIARMLMDHAVAWARSKGVRQVRLFTDRGNHGARTAFSRLGFRETMVEMTIDLPA